MSAQAQDADAEWTPRAMLLRRRADAESQGGSAEIDIEEIDALLARLSVTTPDTTVLVERCDKARTRLQELQQLLDGIYPIIRKELGPSASFAHAANSAILSVSGHLVQIEQALASTANPTGETR